MSFDETLNIPIDTKKHEHLRPIDTDKHQNLFFKGPNGEDCATIEDLARAREAHKRATLYLKAFDVNRGPIEIPYGSGEVQVCVGHKFVHETDALGMTTRREVPVHKTYRF